MKPTLTSLFLLITALVIAAPELLEAAQQLILAFDGQSELLIKP